MNKDILNMTINESGIFEPVSRKSDAEYRDLMEFPMELLAATLVELGLFEDIVLVDNEIVDIATRKLKMLFDLAKLTTSEEVLKIAMRG
jgi:hypothetical protein